MKTHVLLAISASLDLVASIVLYIFGLHAFAVLMAVVAVGGFGFAFYLWQRTTQG